MNQKALVTIGTDGPVDYVKLPSGVRHTLGSLSVLRFVVELAPRALTARTTLDEYLKNGSAMLTVDLDRMWTLLKPRYSRWASTTSFMNGHDRTHTDRTLGKQGDTMANDSAQQQAIQGQIGEIEEQIGLLQKLVKEAGPGSASQATMAEQISSLQGLVKKLRSDAGVGSQTNNSDFYPSPAPVLASYDAFTENTELAETIVARVQAANQKIDKLVAAGKKFDAPRAKQDLHTIASRVASIASDVDLAQPWVSNDLQKLAERADKIHGLFEKV